MDQATLVENEIQDGERLIDLLTQDRVDVSAAFWLKMPQNDEWYFHIVTKLVEEAGPAAAYHAVLKALRQLQPKWIGPFQIKVIGASDPLAIAAVDLRDRFPARIVTRLRNTRLGDTFIDAAYIYRSPVTS